MHTGALDEVQQRLREPRLQMPKQHVLDLLARLPQPLAQNFEQENANIGMFLEDWNKISAMQHQDLTLGHCDRIRRPLPAVDQGNLAKNFSGAHDVENDLLSLRGNRTHFDPSP